VWPNVMLSPCDRMSCSHIWHHTFLCVALHVRNPLCGQMYCCPRVTGWVVHIYDTTQFCVWHYMWEIPCVAKCTVVPVWQDELFTYMTLHIFVCGTTCEKSLVWQDGDLFKCATLLSYSHGVVQMCDKRLWDVVKMKMNFHGKLFKCATNDSGMLFKWEYTVHGELFKCAIHASGCCSNANAVSWKVIQTCDDWLWMLFKCKYTLMESCSNVRCYSCSLVKLFKRATNDSGCCSNESTLSWRCSNMRQTTLHVVQMKINSHGRIQIRDKRLWMLFKWKSTLMESRWNARDAIGWLWPLQICTTHSELHSAPNGRNWHMNESCNCAQLEMSYCPTVFPCHVVHMSWANVWCYSFIRYHV